jgi:tetratricopeptide (TPR) repeat protein
MRPAKLVLLFAAALLGARAMDAEKPIKLVRSRFVNGEVIKLDMLAQEQILKGDLASAARTIELAMQKDPTLWLTYFLRARLFAQDRKYELAIEDCNWVLRKYPQFIEAALLRADANAQLGRYADSLKELNYIIRIRPHTDSYARALWCRAWFLAECPDPSFRNGAQAVADAKIACKLRNWDDASSINTLAAAYAETGDFDSAIQYAQQALAIKGITAEESKRIQRHLASFKQHEPIRFSR